MRERFSPKKNASSRPAPFKKLFGGGVGGDFKITRGDTLPPPVPPDPPIEVANVREENQGVGVTTTSYGFFTPVTFSGGWSMMASFSDFGSWGGSSRGIDLGSPITSSINVLPDGAVVMRPTQERLSAQEESKRVLKLIELGILSKQAGIAMLKHFAQEPDLEAELPDALKAGKKLV